MNRSFQNAVCLGLTGGIGSGKSTVAKILVEYGATLVDSDQIAREVTAAGGAAMAAITEVFGADFVDATGALHRDRMRAHVFSQPVARQQLEAIVHPLVARLSQECAGAALAAGHRLVVLDIPLLAESAYWPCKLGAILVVDCRESTQIERVMARNALPREAVQSIMAAQASRSHRRAMADAVLYNDGLPLHKLQEQVGQIAQQFGL